MMVGGGVGAAFTGGATLGLVGAGANVLAADAAAEGAEKAAKKQEDAAAKAIATQEAAAKRAEQAFAPYQQTGQNALGTLGQFMGFPSASNALGTSGGMGGTSLGALPASAQTDVGLRPEPATPTKAVARNPADASQQTQAAMQTQSGYTPTGQSVGMFAGGSLVQMRAPTGEVQWVPRDRAPFLAQRGAVEVN